MYRVALRSIISELIRQGRLMLVAEFSVSRPKTRDVVDRLGKLGLKSVLIVTEQQEENIELSVRNLGWSRALEVDKLDPVSLIEYENVLITIPGLRRLEERLL
jgi:large subunit ribosomal protein L4